MGQKVYVSGDAKISFFAYDNNLYGVQNFEPYGAAVRFIVRGGMQGIRDVETGEIYDKVEELPGSGKPMDAASWIPEEQEYAVDVHIPAGGYRFFNVLPAE